MQLAKEMLHFMAGHQDHEEGVSILTFKARFHDFCQASLTPTFQRYGDVIEEEEHAATSAVL